MISISILLHCSVTEAGHEGFFSNVSILSGKKLCDMDSKMRLELYVTIE